MYQISNYINHKNYSSLERDTFQKTGFVYLNNFLTIAGLNFFDKAYLNLNKSEMRKEFLMTQTGNTPRKMFVIGGKSTNRDNMLISIYTNKVLIKLLSFLTDSEVVECPDKIENVIFTSLSRSNDEHGWHLDDYPFALIIGINSSKKSIGGNVQFIDLEGQDREINLSRGDSYLMRSDLIKHRVSPLKQNSLRTIVNFTYSTKYKIIVPNGTAHDLCDV